MLEETLISADMRECCTFHKRTEKFNAYKPCIRIKKPPGLYQQIIEEDKKKQNACPSGKESNQTVVDDSKTRVSSVWSESFNKSLKLSLKLVMNSFKLAFNVQRVWLFEECIRIQYWFNDNSINKFALGNLSTIYDL